MTDVWMNGTRIPAFVDSGADKSMMSRELAEELKLDILTTNMKFKAINLYLRILPHNHSAKTRIFNKCIFVNNHYTIYVQILPNLCMVRFNLISI